MGSKTLNTVTEIIPDLLFIDDLYVLHLIFRRNNIYYLTLWTFSFEIKASSLSDTSCLLQYVVSPHCDDKGMSRCCTIYFLPNYFVMTSYQWNAVENTSM